MAAAPSPLLAFTMLARYVAEQLISSYVYNVNANSVKRWRLDSRNSRTAPDRTDWKVN